MKDINIICEACKLYSYKCRDNPEACVIYKDELSKLKAVIEKKEKSFACLVCQVRARISAKEEYIDDPIYLRD